MDILGRLSDHEKGPVLSIKTSPLFVCLAPSVLLAPLDPFPPWVSRYGLADVPPVRPGCSHSHTDRPGRRTIQTWPRDQLRGELSLCTLYTSDHCLSRSCWTSIYDTEQVPVLIAFACCGARTARSSRGIGTSENCQTSIMGLAYIN